MFYGSGLIPCRQCNLTTNHRIQTSFQFPDTNKFILVRLHNFNYVNGQLMRLDSNITDYDTEKIIFPNIDNVSLIFHMELIVAIMLYGREVVMVGSGFLMIELEIILN